MESTRQPAASTPIPPSDVVAVIPARHASTRFPGKALADLEGRPLIAHVVAAARAAVRVGTVLVATDHPDIAAAAETAGAQAILTRSDHASGTDRVGEAVAARTEPFVLNIQGDEPLLPPPAIDRLVELFETHEADVTTLACPLREGTRIEDPNVVKVVMTGAGKALYFSRAAIPAVHPQRPDWPPAWRHVGLYGFRREALEAFLAAPPTPLERVEGLEQLRMLELGQRIVVGPMEDLPSGVDTPEDLEVCRQVLRGRRE
jgi:3-deoxy-manno-octulosonate cytidylyltransferase (CMP-KDO synthetase)